MRLSIIQQQLRNKRDFINDRMSAPGLNAAGRLRAMSDELTAAIDAIDRARNIAHTKNIDWKEQHGTK